MPIVDCVGLLKAAVIVAVWVKNHLEKMGKSERIKKRVFEDLEFILRNIETIKPYVKKDYSTEDIKKILVHLENAKRIMEEKAGQGNPITKFACADSNLFFMKYVEAEINSAKDQLNIFLSVTNLIMHCNAADCQDTMAMMLVNSKVGISIIADSSVRRPPAPSGLTIQVNENKLKLSWKPCGAVDDYEVCYDENNNLTVPVGNVTAVEIGLPQVSPGKVYTMRVRGINKGGTGEWSNSVVGQITKPFPQKPTISDLHIRSTTAVVTAEFPVANCSTESPVTRMEVGYAMASNDKSTQWSNSYLEIGYVKNVGTLSVNNLQPETHYTFRVRTRNTEGWSEHSKSKEGTTLALPPKPVKPKLPVLVVTKKDINLVVKMPEEASCTESPCTKSPIVSWKVHGFSTDGEKIEKYTDLNIDTFMAPFCCLSVTELKPTKQYILQVLGKNEAGWGDPSEKFKIHIAKPSLPTKFRVSSKRSDSLIKVRWNAPDTLATYYEILKRTKKGKYNEKAVEVPGNKLSATFTNLKHNTEYYFKIRACNNESYTSNWSNEIVANTRLSKAIKTAASPLVFAAGTIAAPLVTTITVGAVGGMCGHDAGGKVGAVAGGAAGTVGGAAIGIVGAPLVGAGLTHTFINGIDSLSEQSDD